MEDQPSKVVFSREQEIYKTFKNQKYKDKLSKGELTRNRLIITCLAMVLFSAVTSAIDFYHRKMYVSLLRSGMSTLEGGFKKAVADAGVSSVTDTKLWDACDIRTIDKRKDDCKKELSVYFKGIKPYVKKNRSEDTVNTYDKGYLCRELVGHSNMWWHLNSKTHCSGWDNYTFYFNKGMKVDALFIGKNDSYIVGQIILDTNGDAKPNRWGRDAFMFNVLADGTLVPYAGLNDCLNLAHYMNVSKEYVLKQKHWKYADTCSLTTSADGTACAARIVESGWKMDY